jgi:hypothetical protein
LPVRAPTPPDAIAAVARAPVAAPAIPPTAADSKELEASDERHRSARRFARVAVSEIILYHEADVRAGRQAKDLWMRLRPDLKLCLETYEKRVPKEVRDRFDYLYDELIRQLAEGDPEKLGPDSPWQSTS